MSTALTLSFAVVLLAAAPAGSLKVTQRHLVAVCLDGAPVRAGTRSWTLGAAPVTLVATMRNRPRAGVADADPGHAQVTFTPEPGHRYEIEVGAPSSAFAQRVFARDEWTPVVRNRTTDRVVSSEVRWVAAACAGSTSAQR